ncbi:TIGR03747 family integrating conjugative element membrane protein [Dickeya dianthicola]|jgi:integrating conjugative element membrane protein, PFL_4697 family|uniref:TIGR03747 family integrating conjugative element membrane protein n=1 Tax=Enterobacterales TaxID=91347 RepID=UPI000E64BDD1|nr:MULTISPECIES: TIGR03747 family integrating conjugative element membrane protein [Enterobacterales]AYA08451.1 TIGR03747 family integrating conjugative element membrane protein [Rahnella aquatilis]MBU9839311.1 TIGR03747 family integrating conjugative element membrane protein [Rahnella aceris]MCI4186791.1 TIGR03747 family integrating conjugative element membrane protein [Dickeya dianthicola]QBJ09404.1 TIGR03747 family integrating conjugative element membrane protein [Rahnella aquatilis]
MAEEKVQQRQQTVPPKQPGLFITLFWLMPWKVVGILLASLLVSLLIEYAGMTFIWAGEGAEHSRQVMLTESGYLSEGFTRSLMLSQPVNVISAWIQRAYQWFFLDSGFINWVNTARSAHIQGGTVETISRAGSWLARALWEYLQATVYVTVIFAIRVAILVLSVPLFIMVSVIGVVDGLVRRDLRRYGAGYESSFVYHHAKRYVKPAMYGPCMLYLAWPTAVWPNLLLLPSAMMLGFVLTVVTGAFKKYL